MAEPAMRIGTAVVCSSLFVLGAVAATPADGGESLSIRRGFANTFAMSAAAPRMLRPVRVRGSKIGPADAKPGEITVGLAPPGGAVGVAKLHVFERVPRAVTFSVVAMRGGRRVAAEKVCGRLDVDTWVALPAESTTAVIDHFVEGDCR